MQEKQQKLEIQKTHENSKGNDSKNIIIILVGVLIAFALILNYSTTSISWVANLPVDSTTGAQMVIDYNHAEIHNGTQFKRGFQNDALNIDDTIMVLFVTPNTTKWAHFTLVAKTSDGGAKIEFFEDVTTTNDGTLITAFNRNRNSLNLATTLTYHTPTIVNTGTKLAEKWIGETDKKADLGGDTRGYSEFILKQNTKYLVKLTAYANDMKAAVGGDWYEDTNK